MFKIHKSIWLAVIALAVLASVMAPGSMAGDRLVAQLDEPFEVNGEMVPAGKLLIEELRDYSPVATLNKLSIDGECLGLVLAHQIDGERARTDELIFSRSRAGHLVLDGIAIQGQPTREVYSYQDAVDGGRWIAARDASRTDGLMAADRR